MEFEEALNYLKFHKAKKNLKSDNKEIWKK